MVVQLGIGRLEEHGLKHADSSRTVLHGHLRQTAALFGADGTDAKIDRHTARSLIDHDLQAAFHLVLLDHIELTVGAKREDAGNTAVDDVIHLCALLCFIDLLVFVHDGQDRHYDTLNKICIHTAL